ncbi:MAG TPA: G1 family glutamic endopeptidase [Solirubrobacteraceae bacterium]|nr:G1 family glutamic endopeptidase [Solirubrobacteraceae bacterium]
MRLLILRVAAATAAIVLAGGAAAQAHTALHAPKHKRGATTASNWSGYSVDGTNAVQAIGTWQQPAASCGIGENSWSSPWVGIDGDNSNTVEQTGTDSDCNNGQPYYYAWYEMYPQKLYTINMPIVPGHIYTSSVTYASGVFTLKLSDDSTNPITTFVTQQASKKARRSSIEWIMEGPSSSGLTNFGQVNFSKDSGTINGQTAGLGSFANPNQITMVSNSGAVRAQPSALSGNAFGVAFVSH